MDASASPKQTAADPGTAKDGAIRPFSLRFRKRISMSFADA